MIELKRIQNSNTDEFERCFSIYQNSFPIFEQRTRHDQIEALKNREYHFEVIQNDMKETLGLLLTWQTDAFVYVEHLAVLESARGGSIGTRALELLLNKTAVPIILEIDPPIDEISIRRKGFYERLGFALTEHKHIHPSYKKNTHPHELKILSLPKIDQAQYEAFYTYMLQTVMRYSERYVEQR